MTVDRAGARSVPPAPSGAGPPTRKGNPLSTSRSLAVAALVAAPILPVTMTGRAEAAPAALVASPAKPAASTVAHRKHLAHVIAEANRRAREARKHAIAKANREARRAAGGARGRVLAAARSAVGRPYVYGTAGPRSFDCSGLTQWSYRAAGKWLPRTAFGQSRAGHATRSPRPGDLLIYSGAAHVALVYAVRAGRVVDTIVARHSGTTITHQRPYTGYTVRAVLA